MKRSGGRRRSDSAPQQSRWVLALSCLVGSDGLASSLSLDRGPVVLGRTESVGVTLQVEEAPGEEDRPLRLAINVGSFGEITRVKPGVYRTVYVPPPTRFPQVALVALWRETGSEAPIEFLRFSLYGLTQVPISAKPGAEVTVAIEADTFGPVISDSRGKATVQVAVPPNVHDAAVKVKERGGAIAERKVPIEVPPYNRLTASLVPHAILADGKSWARLDVFYALGGADLPADRVKVSASVGSATFERAHTGRYTYRYLAPAGASAKEVQFSISVEGDPSAKASATLSLGLPAPTRVVVRPPSDSLPADGKSTAPLSILVFDAAGLGLPGQQVEVSANGQRLEGLAYQGAGRYQASFVAPSVYPPGGLLQFVARVTAPGGQAITATANYQLKATPSPKALSASIQPAPVPADGRTEARLSLDVRDGAGLPLEGAQLILVASHGTLGKISDEGGGRYSATYVAPDSLPEGEPVVRVVDSAGGFEQSLPIPVRRWPGRLLVGVRAGLAHSLGDLVGPRLGADAWMPIRLGAGYLGVGVSATYGSASRNVADESGELSSRSEAWFLPVALRAGYEVYAGRAASLSVGASGAATYARFKTSLTGASAALWGLGGSGFLSLGYAAGPGQAFAELSYGVAPVRTADFNLDAGGLSADLGYRFGIF